MKQFLKFLLLLLFSLGAARGGYAQKPALPEGKQGQAAIDSMLKDLPKAKEDTNKVKLLSGLSYGYSTINPDEGIKYGQQSLDLAARLKWQNGIAKANSCLGNNYFRKSDYPKALGCYQKTIKIDEEIGDKQGIAGVTGNMGSIYVYESDYPKALEYDFKALKIFEEIGNKQGMTNSILSIGIVYHDQGDYPKTLEYDFKALRMCEEIGDKEGVAIATLNIGLVYGEQSAYPKALEYDFKALKTGEETGNKLMIEAVTGNIGNVYEATGDYPKALEYYFKALKMCEEIGEKYGIATVTGSIGTVYKMQGDYPKALDYYFKRLKIDEEIGDKIGIMSVTGNIGNVYSLQKNYTMAIDYMQKGLKIAEEIGNKRGIAASLNNIGTCFLSVIKDTAKSNGTNTTEPAQREYLSTGTIPTGKAALLRRAIEYLQRSITIGKEINAPDILQGGYENLAEAYKLSGDYKKAIEYADNSRAIKDSVFSKQNSDKIAKMENDRKQYGDSLKAADIKKVADIKAQHRRNYEYIGAGVIVLLIGFTFLITRNNKLLSKEKKQSDNLLLNILPEEVASQLKKTGAAAARRFDDVTVLFTDFVNFTSAGERMSPEALIEELNTCFKAFDEITGRHNVEKIKTIGDAYLAVAGLPTADPRHAENIVSAAIDINAFMQDRLTKLGERTFDIRIGIHSGSVVAGIVGLKKFAYDIWGDTVNTAARMEQNSDAGKINISQATYELVKDKFACEYRGEIDAKGKGGLRMYYVNG